MPSSPAPSVSKMAVARQRSEPIMISCARPSGSRRVAPAPHRRTIVADTGTRRSSPRRRAGSAAGPTSEFRRANGTPSAAKEPTPTAHFGALMVESLAVHGARLGHHERQEHGTVTATIGRCLAPHRPATRTTTWRPRRQGCRETSPRSASRPPPHLAEEWKCRVALWWDARSGCGLYASGGDSGGGAGIDG